MLSEISQTQKEMCCTISLIEAEKPNGGGQGLGAGGGGEMPVEEYEVPLAQDGEVLGS